MKEPSTICYQNKTIYIYDLLLLQESLIKMQNQLQLYNNLKNIKIQNRMSFQTQLTPVDIEVFQSLLYNADKEIPKIKVTLEFDDEHKYKRFMSRLNPTPNEDQDVAANTDSDEENQEGQQSKDDMGLSYQASVDDDIEYVQKLSRLQMSIILKQNYKEKIERIITETGVRILIVPQKVKYFGSQQECIEQAMSRVYDIKLNIIISSIEKYGKQAYQSQFLRKKLQKCGIKLGRVAQKYYYWYDQSLSNPQLVKQTLSEIFNKSYHVFFPLLENYEVLLRKFNQKYITAILQANAKLYTQFLDHEINEEKNYTNAELNCKKNQIIIHVAIKEQAQKIKFQVKKFYSQLIHFFVHFRTYEQQEIDNIDKIQATLNEKGILWSRYEDLLVITFSNKNINKPNETITDMATYLENRIKQFVQSLRPVFELNSNCYIEYLRNNEQIEDEQFEQKKLPLYKKVTKQYKSLDGIFIISPKTQTVGTCLDVIEMMVLKPKLIQDKTKKKGTQNSTLNVPIDQSNNLLQDTTTVIQKTNLTMQNNEVSQMMEKGEEVCNKSILGELRDNPYFNNYNFYFSSGLGSKKYQEIDEVKKGKATRCENIEQYEQKLSNITRRKFQIFDAILPDKINNKLVGTKDVVTVFVKDTEKDSLLQANVNVNVYLLTNSKIMSNNGWLVNTIKSDIVENNYKYQVASQKIQIVHYIKFIQEC